MSALKTSLTRERHPRKERSERWLFVCEGKKTEPNYITSLINYANSITKEAKLKYNAVGVGMNTESLVRSVDSFFDDAHHLISGNDIPYAKIFVVFDKDSFSPYQFDNAIKKAEEMKYIPIWSNECFELWFLLHFYYYTSRDGRKEYFYKLSKLLGKPYNKSDNIFKMIHTPKRIKNALNFSERLASVSAFNAPSDRKPCTKMHVLVRELERKLKIDLTKAY